MKRLNLHQILTLVTACAMLASMVIRPGTCDMDMGSSRTDAVSGSDCCNQDIHADGKPASHPMGTDNSHHSPSGSDNCGCEFRSGTDSDARDANAVPATDLSLTGPVVTGETAFQSPVYTLITNLTNRAPPGTVVPAYILYASFLN